MCILYLFYRLYFTINTCICNAAINVCKGNIQTVCLLFTTFGIRVPYEKESEDLVYFQELQLSQNKIKTPLLIFTVRTKGRDPLGFKVGKE